MSVTAVLLLVNALLMIALPLVVALVIRRALGPRWALLGGGALAFVAAQVVHMLEPMAGAFALALVLVVVILARARAAGA